MTPGYEHALIAVLLAGLLWLEHRAPRKRRAAEDRAADLLESLGEARHWSDYYRHDVALTEAEIASLRAQLAEPVELVRPIERETEGVDG